MPVYGQRDRLDEDGAVKNKDYWLTDGLYGSFNCILWVRIHSYGVPIPPPLCMKRATLYIRPVGLVFPPA